MAQPLTVLIIDDCVEDRQVYRRYLQQDQEHNYTILEKDSGEEALELCRQLQPDVILLDFLLPDQDGLEFLAELQKLVKGSMPAIVMLTGYGNEAIAVQAMKSGVHDYLVKEQTTAERLRSTLHSAIIQTRLRQELSRSEEQLHNSQKFIKRIAETTPGILYVYDLVEKRNVYLNGKVGDLLGYTPQTIQDLGKEFLIKLMHPEDLVQLPQVFQQFDSAKDGDIIEHEYRMHHANGGWCWFFSRNSVFTRNADGSPRQIVGTAFDITARKQVEEELRSSNERFRLAAAAINALIYEWDVKKGTVTRTEGLTRILGYSVEEATPTIEWWQEQIHPEDQDFLVQQFQNLPVNQNRYTFEYRIRHKNKQYLYVLDQGVITRDENGQPVRVVGSTTDISDRKRAETERNQLLQLEKLARAEAEAANHTKDEFVAMVSHDLRSPLNAILGWSQLLRTRQLDETTFTRALETIERNAQSQSKLLEDLLDMSRVLRGKLQLEFCQVDLAAIIGVAIETAYPSAKAKNIHLKSVIDESIPLIPGDINRLLQVLGNLLSNAIKFTPPEGQITVQLSYTDSEAHITVTDTGIGIKSEFLPYVFDRYRQADCQHKQHGLGLGLAIARYLIELHGGAIHVTSPGEGQGTTFTIKLLLYK
ncbi:PAS domain-containing protein [Anabaena sp. FACHB-709]|uniref:histidine kinase n=2 Tax=Nostocaceae TaxID=1162 RepID=A0A1Z4KHS7_ANAVA|nr:MULTISPECIES: PAS domain-containing protein [Nostocaceae]BAY68522.1 two-component hybrid sensor and regulator [Trichormus variabilis NIES-23]HBW32617.1 hybrid sensor histidine kinase/response regulator [Nostoc sp. UBA8866]MBD2171671.1 PAS domain-containing protein [Anabaena cylindrica FACHB-318]MBD2264190.1 PAS domain-containing protein [Anabaena sp. FACHB-709]MBD2273533.1 PAS domain-containing protein [Nostoc sp. PCC 7120 = FACHB-418]